VKIAHSPQIDVLLTDAQQPLELATLLAETDVEVVLAKQCQGLRCEDEVCGLRRPAAACTGTATLACTSCPGTLQAPLDEPAGQRQHYQWNDR
jgi:hypothetical protein